MSDRVPTGLFSAGFLVLATLGVVFVRAFGSLGDGWDDILEFLPFYVGAIAVGFVFNVVYSQYAEARDRRLTREHAGAVVLGAQMSPALKRWLRSNPKRYATTELVGRAPHLFTAVANANGISLWNGAASTPVKFCEIDWDSVTGIRHGIIRLEYKNVRGLHIETLDPGSEGALEIAPLPKGPFRCPTARTALSN